MHVDLPPELERFVAEKVASGEYSTPGEVVRSALYLLRQRELPSERQLEELRREIQLGRDAAGRGDIVEGPELFRELRALEAQLDGGSGA